MKSGTVKILAIVVILLFGVMYALNTTDRSSPGSEQGPLVPELKERLNDLETVTITDADGALTLDREADAWVAREKSDYPVDTGTLRQLLLAIADASRIEQKTANTSLYDRLGVQHPADEGGDGVLVEGSAKDFDFAVILGDQAQGDYRYARIPSETQSWLIDRNPELPEEASGWLQSEIVDIPSAAVQSVEIRHADGETIRIRKESAAAGTFTVEGIPEGRELSYPTVVNSIAGALASLTLEDVARIEGDGAAAGATVAFETFDGLRVDITTTDIDEQAWITVEASTIPVAAPADGPDADATPDNGEAEETEQPDAGADDEAGAPAPGPAEQASAINARTQGWRYRIPDYKADQLARRWDDLLKAQDDEEE